MEKIFAVYSEKQKMIAGSRIYRRSDGSLVEVTCVENTPNCPGGCYWDDKVDMGEVTEFVKIGYWPADGIFKKYVRF